MSTPIDLRLLLELNEYDLKYIENPNWDEFFADTQHIHDWRTYIPQGIMVNWKILSTETKQITYFMAKRNADREMQWEEYK